MSKYNYNQIYGFGSKGMKRNQKRYGKDYRTSPKKGYVVGGYEYAYKGPNMGMVKVPVYTRIQPKKQKDKPPKPAPAPPVQQAPPPPMAPQRLPVQQPNQMDMLMPLLMAAIAPKPAPPPPEPVTYASAGQAAQSVPGVKINRPPAMRSKQNTMGTTGAFNRNSLRISNLNI